jgi:small subunit ribosomal protein S17
MNNRRRLTGFVVSDKMMKTVVVQVTRTYQHPLYKKVVHESNRFKAHDELGAKVGDEVLIVESRPLSRDKHWVVESIVRRPGETLALVDDAVELDAPVAAEAVASAPAADEAAAEEAVAAEEVAAEPVAVEAVAETPEAELEPVVAEAETVEAAAVEEAAVEETAVAEVEEVVEEEAAAVDAEASDSDEGEPQL